MGQTGRVADDRRMPFHYRGRMTGISWPLVTHLRRCLERANRGVSLRVRPRMARCARVHIEWGDVIRTWADSAVGASLTWRPLSI
jgi:hypothetical protein